MKPYGSNFLQHIPGAITLETDDVVEDGSYVVDKTTRLEMVSRLRPSDQWRSIPCYYMPSTVFVDLFGRQPKLNNTSKAKSAIRDFPMQMELPDDYSVFDLVRNNFSRLFDYPIHISKLSRFP